MPVTSALTSHSPGTSVVSFTDGDTFKRVTVTDAQVTILGNPPLVTVIRDTIADINDPGWVYVANIVSIANGSFDVSIAALSGDQTQASGEYPNESVTLTYFLITT